MQKVNLIRTAIDEIHMLEKPFVAINTSIPIDCQVFAAAHELYHIWYEKNPDILPLDLYQ